MCLLQYYNEIRTDDNLILSIDNIVLDLYLSRPEARDRFMALMNLLPIEYAVNVVHWESYRPGSFRDQFSIHMQDKNSFWVGATLNGRSPEWGRFRLDFNPNKVAMHEVFQLIMRFLLMNTRIINRRIKRFDLALDIPVSRCDCFLIKDSRAYIERRHGQEWTQYLGAKSSTAGRVKLYNKQVESKLAFPLTRLEITLDPEDPYDRVQWPKLYVLDDLQLCFSELKATETERFILSALLQGYGSLNDLGRKTRVKIETLLNMYVKDIQITKEDYEIILNHLYEFTKEYTQFEENDLDQPPKKGKYPDWVSEAESVSHSDELLLEENSQSDIAVKGGE